METGASTQSTHQEIIQALARIDTAKSRRFGSLSAVAVPSFKRLVLQVVPNATVRRVGSWQGRQVITATYECFIGSHRISTGGYCDGHSTPDKAWVCLARFIASPAFAAARATGAFQ